MPHKPLNGEKVHAVLVQMSPETMPETVAIDILRPAETVKMVVDDTIDREVDNRLRASVLGAGEEPSARLAILTPVVGQDGKRPL